MLMTWAVSDPSSPPAHTQTLTVSSDHKRVSRKERKKDGVLWPVRIKRPLAGGPLSPPSGVAYALALARASCSTPSSIQGCWTGRELGAPSSTSGSGWGWGWRRSERLCMAWEVEVGPANGAAALRFCCCWVSLESMEEKGRNFLGKTLFLWESEGSLS